MKYKISKELFEEVCKGSSFGGINEDTIEYSYPCGIMEGSWVNYEVSINDFYFDCKEWALNKGYYFEIKNMLSGTYLVLHFNYKKITDLSKNFSNLKSEQQTLFDACQWILENDNAKD